MSVEAISWALKQPIKHSTAKFVLVAMANCADGNDFVAWPSIQYLIDATGQDRKTVQANLNRLREIGYLEDTGERKGQTRQVVVYRLKEPEIGRVKEAQKRNSTENGTVPKFPVKRPNFPGKEAQFSQETGPKTGHGTVKEPSKEPSRNRQRAREVELPDWLPAEVWGMWDRYRVSLNAKSWTADAMRLSLRKLGEFRQQGFSPQAVIENAIEKGWRGLYPPGEAKQAKPAKHSGFSERSYVGTDPDAIEWA